MVTGPRVLALANEACPPLPLILLPEGLPLPGTIGPQASIHPGSAGPVPICGKGTARLRGATGDNGASRLV